MSTTELKQSLDCEPAKAEILISTNIGHIPDGDYKDIKAMEFGFDSYEDMVEQGFYLD